MVGATRRPAYFPLLTRTRVLLQDLNTNFLYQWAEIIACLAAVSNRTFPSKNTIVKNPTAPADLIGMNGYIINGKIHAHMTLANPERAFGGHLEPGTTVFTFAIVTLGVMNDGADFSRLDDKTYR